jgi:FkbM family methyltransferase
MTFVSYAQNFEDVLLWRALGDVTAGRYLDIGAQDPVIDSVSHAFYLAGWRGVHVEPAASCAAKLRGSRPDEVVIQALVTDVTGPLEFFEIEDTGISTGRPDIAARHASRGFQPHKVLAPTIRLDALMSKTDGDLHWMKVDVEGMEADVLRSWGRSPVRPWLLLVESTFPGSQLPTHHEWLEEVLRRDYSEVFFDGLNRYFVHQSQQQRQAAFTTPANVFDGFAVAQHHFSARCLRSELETAHARFSEELAGAARRREEVEASAASAIENEIELRKQLTAARAKEAALLTRIVEDEREHSASIDKLWRERRAAESDLRRKFKIRHTKLEEALKASHRAEAAGRCELARLDEWAKNLERDLIVHTKKLDQVHREARMEHERDRQQLETLRATEGEVRVELASLMEKSENLERDLDRQQSALVQTRAALQRADALIRQARQAPSDRWQRAGRRLGFSRTPAAIEALAAWSAFDASGFGHQANGTGSGIDISEVAAVPPIRSGNPYHRVDSLHELLAWDDIDFIRCAYVTVLGRQPDPDGEAYYAARIRAGHSKLEVLWQLRRSSEGARHDPGIAGLDRALKRAAWCRKPVVGDFLRIVLGGENDAPMSFGTGALEDKVAAPRDRLAPEGLDSGKAGGLELPRGKRRVIFRADASLGDSAPVSEILESIARQPEEEGPNRNLNPYESRIFRQLKATV